MSKIRHAFENGKAFIAFITCGAPDLETTASAVRAAVENGADLLELGIPFSDPTAEGPVIQGANIRALSGGITTDLDSIIRVVRQNTEVPCAVGFGISTPRQAGQMADIPKGIIVGSAIVKLLEKYGREAPVHIGEYVKSMKEVLR